MGAMCSIRNKIDSIIASKRGRGGQIGEADEDFFAGLDYIDSLNQDATKTM